MNQEPVKVQRGTGTPLFHRAMSEVKDMPNGIPNLMLEVWSPTPFMVDVEEFVGQDEIRNWCNRNIGDESSPIHEREGLWHRASVTINASTWYGFATEELMKRFQKQFGGTEQ